MNRFLLKIEYSLILLLILSSIFFVIHLNNEKKDKVISEKTIKVFEKDDEKIIHILSKQNDIKNSTIASADHFELIEITTADVKHNGFTEKPIQSTIKKRYVYRVVGCNC